MEEAMKDAPKLSPDQRLWLEDLAAGESPWRRVFGAKDNERAMRTVLSLSRAGLIDAGEITDMGRLVIGWEPTQVVARVGLLGLPILEAS
jgi:hypothetical protein